MKMGRIAAGIVAGLALAPAAHGAFQFNYTVTPQSGALAGKNLFKFYAFNDQRGEQAGSHSLLVMEVHFKTQNQPFGFDFRDTDGDTKSDANIFGKDFDETNAASTFMRIGSYSEWIPVLPNPNTFSTKAGAADPAQNYSNVTDFLVSGFSTNKALDATQGLGRFYGAALVPAGVDINVVGKVAAEVGGVSGTGAAPLEDPSLLDASSPLELALAQAQVSPGPDYFFNFTATAPEPGALSLLAVPALTLLRRRRR